LCPLRRAATDGLTARTRRGEALIRVREGIVRTVARSGPTGPGIPGAFAGDGGPATEARLWSPVSVAVDSAGNLLISDGVNKRVRKVIGIAAPGLVGGR
jgi:hypothetical protein